MVWTVCSTGGGRNCILGEPGESKMGRLCRKKDNKKKSLKWDKQKEEMQTSEVTDALTCYILHYKSDKQQNIPHTTPSVDSETLCTATQTKTVNSPPSSSQ